MAGGNVLALNRGMVRRNAEPITLRGIQVLVVCDDVERCTLFADALRYAGALATMAHSAADAVAVMDRLHANVIVAELRDAEARASLIAALRALPPESGGKSPALALTRSHDDADAVLASGFQLHVAMPVRAAELCAAVATLAQQSAVWPRL
jgi:CheY-like chemotaxis protein